MSFKIGLTGLPDGEWAKDIKVGKIYIFFNGHMKKIDGKPCEAVHKIENGKYMVKFEDHQAVLAYNTELKDA